MKKALNHQFLAEKWQEWGESKPLLQTRIFLILCDHLLNKGTVTISMVQDFITGFEMIPTNIVSQDKEVSEQINRLVKPVTESILEYFKGEYQDYLLTNTICEKDGLREELDINGWKIPITKQEIRNFLKAKDLLAFTSQDIQHAKLHYAKARGWTEKSAIPDSIVNGIPCRLEYDEGKLHQIFDRLITDMLLSSNTRFRNFLFAFGKCEKPKMWGKISWLGTNPELATLVFRLTGKTPVPKIVNPLFSTVNKYDSHSHIGRTGNTRIKKLLK